jgi:N-methylhydantoinase A
VSLHDVACDIGGGFVDLLACRPDAPPILLKRPRDDALPLAALLDALLAQAGIAPAQVARLRLSTTLATNALASGSAAPTALITTQGFEDVPELGRQSRRDPDALDPPPPTPPWLAPRAWRFGVAGRIGADGAEVAPLDASGLAAFLATLPQGTPLALCLLFAPTNPAHEIALERIIAAARPDLRLSLSHRVDPALREFERMLATLADAALKPLLARALHGFRVAPWVLRAEGTLAPLDSALARPLGLALSGPAAGARAVAFWAEGDAIGLDIGSTTADVSLVQAGQPLAARELALGTLRLRCPALDVESLPIGGGTTLALAAGRIRFGAAARPACLGGAVATLTDAALAAGWLPAHIAGQALDADAARAALRRGLGTADATPALALAEAQLAEAIRRIALRRGIDPVRALLVIGGGAGPLHGCAIAQRMGARRVLMPPAPGLLSAFGLALAPVAASAETACDVAVEHLATLETLAEAQAQALAAELHRHGLAPRIAQALEMAFAGQAKTLAIAWHPGDTPASIAARFDASHAARRGHAPAAPRRILALRSTAEAPLAPPPRPPAPTHALPAPMQGPALLHGIDATLRIPTGWRAVLRADGALLLEAE